MSRKSYTARGRKNNTPPEVEIDEHVFHCVKMVPGAVLLDFMVAMDAEDPKAMAEGLKDFMLTSIVKEEQEAWTEFIRDPENEVDLDLLVEITADLAGQYLDKSGDKEDSGPTSQPG